MQFNPLHPIMCAIAVGTLAAIVLGDLAVAGLSAWIGKPIADVATLTIYGSAWFFGAAIGASWIDERDQKAGQ